MVALDQLLICAAKGGIKMNRKPPRKGLLMWYRKLESWGTNPICFRDSFMPEMRDIIQIDAGRCS